MLTVKLLHGNAQYNLGLLRLYQSYVVYSWARLEIYTQVTCHFYLEYISIGINFGYSPGQST